MEIRNFTNFWNMERKVYSIYDLQLPAPINLRAAGIFVGTAVPYWGILLALGVPINLSTAIIWLAPPAVLGFIGNKPIFEGKSFIDYLVSRFRYMFEAKRYKGIEPATEKYGEKIELSEFFYTHK